MIISILFTGCNQEDYENPLTNEQLDEDLTIEDYYPFKENVKMEYEGLGNEFAEQTTFIEFVEDNRAQLKVFNPGTVTVKVLEYENGELREIYTEGEFYHIENMISTNNETRNVILKEPLEIGTTWTTSDGYKKSITGIDVDIETPYDDFKALEVTTEFGEERKKIDYYVKDIGHIASLYMDNMYEVKTLLKDIENTPYKTDIRFYYPLEDGPKIAYVEKEIEFSTNGDITNIFENNFKNPESDGLISLISEKTNINSIEFDRGNEIANVDFSQELITEMNAGNAIEVEMLKSIVNTIGNYYGVNDVYISVDGNPYSSGHFSLREGEFFSVDYTNVEKFNK